MLKGHAGIGKFLLDIPGVDINVKDDKGRTVLANMIASLCADKPLTRELVGEIKGERLNGRIGLFLNSRKLCVIHLQSGASYLSQGFVMFFHVSCEGLPGQ